MQAPPPPSFSPFSLDEATCQTLHEALKAAAGRYRTHTLLSFSLPIETDQACMAGRWLSYLPPGQIFWFWHDHPQRLCHLGLGQAMTLTSRGSSRFTALNDGWQGLQANWVHQTLGQTNSDAASPAPLICLGFAFDEASEANTLHAFPNALMSVPALMFRQQGDQASLTLSCSAQAARKPEHVLQGWQALLQPDVSAQPLPADLPFSHHPTQAQTHWEQRVGDALAEITEGKIHKLVLSRRSHLSSPSPFVIPAILAHLHTLHTHSRIYAYGDGRHTLLGATPERLVSLAHTQVEADALAGTSWSKGEESGPAQTLCSEKNTREQDFVVAAVRDSLARCCTQLEAPEPPSILKLPHLSHLHTRIRGQALPGTHLFELVANLHPTPAIGGVPTLDALNWLRQHGETRPAWYGGGIGWMNPQGDGDIGVALRCALVSGKNALLAAGAGIVAGSSADDEWTETEAKMHTLRQVLTENTEAALSLSAIAPTTRCKHQA